jgi:hypothetical protein
MSRGCTCSIDYCCRTPTSQTVDEGDSWSQYGASSTETVLFSLCSGQHRHAVQINDGGWANMDGSSAIKLISGTQGQYVNICSTGGSGNCCDSTTTPRSTFVIEANTGSGGTAWPCRMRIYSPSCSDCYATFTITVNAPAAGGGIHILPMMGCGN